MTQSDLPNIPGLPDLNEENVQPGAVMKPHDVTYSEDDIRQYVERTGETVDAYRTNGTLTVPPGMLMVQPMRIVHANYHYETGVHVSSRLTLHKLPHEGDTVSITGTIGDLFERNGDKYVRLDVVIVDQGGAPLAKVEHTSIYKLKARTGAAG